MALLDDVLAAHGGIDRWRGFTRFSAQFSLNGALLAAKGRDGALKDLAAQGCTRTPSLRIAGFPAADRSSAYRPGRVAIETLDGTTLASRDDPRSALRSRPDAAVWDDLDLVYVCGAALWSCLVSPFVLAGDGVALEPLPGWAEGDETWRRLRAVFPADAGMLAQEKIFYFDAEGLQRRIDHAAIETDDLSIAHYTWAHQAFSGIIVPTLHRGLILQPDGAAHRTPIRLDIEIFDASFD